VNSSGFVFQTVNLSTLTWNVSSITSAESLSYAVFLGTRAGDTNMFYVKTYAIVSNVVGILNTGAIMTPQSMEMTLEIYNFPYLDRTHSVQLNLGLLATTSNMPANATIWLNPDRERYQFGMNESAIYVDLSCKAICDDVIRVVELSTPNGSLIDLQNSFIRMQVENMANAASVVVMKQITFPPGVINITYDPTIGIGPGPSSAEAELDTNWSKPMLALLTVTGLLGVFCIAAASAYLIRLHKQMSRGVEMKKQTYSPLDI